MKIFSMTVDPLYICQSCGMYNTKSEPSSALWILGDYNVSM